MGGSWIVGLRCPTPKSGNYEHRTGVMSGNHQGRVVRRRPAHDAVRSRSQTVGSRLASRRANESTKGRASFDGNETEPGYYKEVGTASGRKRCQDGQETKEGGATFGSPSR